MMYLKISDIKITTTGQRHLCAVIGSAECKKDYVVNTVKPWVQNFHVLSQLAEIDP